MTSYRYIHEHFD